MTRSGEKIIFKLDPNHVRINITWDQCSYNEKSTYSFRCGVSRKPGFQGNIHQSLALLNSRDTDLFDHYLIEAKLNIVESLSQDSRTVTNFNEFISKCFTINQLETVGKAVMRLVYVSVR